MTESLIFLTIDRLKAKNITRESPLDQVIPVRLCKSGWLVFGFFRSTIIEETLLLSFNYGKPSLLELH